MSFLKGTVRWSISGAWALCSPLGRPELKPVGVRIGRPGVAALVHVRALPTSLGRSTLLPAACGHQRARQDRGRRSVPSPLVCAHLVPEVAPWPLWQIQKAALKGFLGRAHRTLQAGQSAPCRCISTLDVQATLEPRAQLPGDPQLLLSSPVGPLGPVTGQRLAGRDTGWPQSLSLGPPCPSRCFPGVTLVSLGVSCNAPTFSLPGSGVWDQDFAERSGSVSRHLSLQSQPRR